MLVPAVIFSYLVAIIDAWVLLIAAPESDFTAFAASNSRQNLLLSLITIGLAALLGIQLLRQSRRADRTARLLSLQRRRYPTRTPGGFQLRHGGRHRACT